MTKSFSNVDERGNAVRIGGNLVRVYETGGDHIVSIDGLWFYKAEAIQLRDWLNNVLQDEKPVEKPMHEHECVDCVYLGSYAPAAEDIIIYDLYFHPSHMHSTVIARYGKDGDYLATLVEHAGQRDPISPIGQAYQRAKAKGLIVDI